ncbi:MAG: hypothetical protein WC426_10945 [Sulfuriferula sp.]
MKKLWLLLGIITMSLSGCYVVPYGDHDGGYRNDQGHREQNRGHDDRDGEHHDSDENH